MKKSLLALLLVLALSLPGFSYTGPRGGHSHSSSYHASRKSHVSGSHDGNYQGGRGSSHKGGHYKNMKTNNHYRDRQHGTPQ